MYASLLVPRNCSLKAVLLPYLQVVRGLLDSVVMVPGLHTNILRKTSAVMVESLLPLNCFWRQLAYRLAMKMLFLSWSRIFWPVNYRTYVHEDKKLLGVQFVKPIQYGACRHSGSNSRDFLGFARAVFFGKARLNCSVMLRNRLHTFIPQDTDHTSTSVSPEMRQTCCPEGFRPRYFGRG